QVDDDAGPAAADQLDGAMESGTAAAAVFGHGARNYTHYTLYSNYTPWHHTNQPPGAGVDASPYDFDFVSIGSGPAGQRGAVQAAKLGRRVARIERRRMMGGVCVDTGTIPSKTFREAVISFVAAARPFGGRAGAGPLRRPTAEQLLARVAQVVSLECQVIENQLRRNDVEVIAGTASFKDPHTLLVQDDAGSR